jgi:alpha-mannosidase
MAPMTPRRLVLVPHTHWDREWYRTHEEFRYRLVRLLDRLLDLLEGDPAFLHFTLDGQTIVLEDYLEVRPEARERIARLVGEGRLLVGPWYVLPDEWLVSGEALVRNLRLGVAQAAEFGGAMPIGYVPDQFGHVGQLPQLFAGFGFDAAALWRGVGDDVDGSLFQWEAPDGTRVLTAHLLGGYSNGMYLPRDPAALAERLRGECARLGERSPVPTVLVMNGNDHAEPEAGLPTALEALGGQLDGVVLEIGTLPSYLARARDEAPESLPVHRGELRSGLRSPLLEGCASARMPQKRADFLNDRLLLHYAEPLSAWLARLGGDGDPSILDLAWRIALQNHPHDSICGCSIDAVHAQMEARFARVHELAGSHLARVCREVAGRVAGGAEAADGEGAPLVVWNPGASGCREAEGVVELAEVVGERFPALHVRDVRGRALPVHAELVAPGHTFASYALGAAVAAQLVRGFPPEFFGNPVCGVRRVVEDGRAVVEVLLGEAAPPDLDWATEREAVAAALAAEGDAPVVFRPRRLDRVRLRFVDELPGTGLRRYTARAGEREAAEPVRATSLPDGGARIESRHWRLEADPAGRVRFVHRPSGRVVEDAVRLVSEGDRGDEYTFDPVVGGERVERPVRADVALAGCSRARVALAIDAVYRLPAGLAAERAARSDARVDLPARIELGLAAGLDRVEVEVSLENTARDHRLRLHLRAPFRARSLDVESAFEVAARPIDPPPDAFGSDAPAEFPTGACPQRSFATLAGDALALTVANRSGGEVEAVCESDGSSALALSVVRAVGWLSRDDLTMRPLPAGPPLATPAAQCLGAHRLEFALRLHPRDDPRRTAEAHAFAAPPLVFAGAARRGDVADGARLLAVDDPHVVVSAIEPRADGALGVRLWNASGDSRSIPAPWPDGARALQVDLAGRALGPAASPLRFGPWQLLAIHLQKSS